MRRLAAIAVIAAAAALAIVVSAPAKQAATTKTTVRVTLKEFKLQPAPKSVSAGKVKFVVTNTGRLMHEIVVIKTNKAPGKLPVAGGEASENGSVGEAADIKPGHTKTVTLTLKAGKYVLICNIKGHYNAGQYSAFTVR
jgi:uncharacterized cupredoxin-like copper-binding protein